MDVSMAMTATVSLLVVLGLVVLAGRLARRMGWAPALPGRAGTGAPRRLALVESLPLDARRRLLLVRCDGREVLVLTGGPQDLWLPQPAATDAP